jgi:transcriptional regulator with XRE-family HTH domain
MSTIVDGLEERIAHELRARREAQGLSMGALAERSGVSKAMIAKVEAGLSNPTATLLGRLCAGLGITLSALMASAEQGRLTLVPAGRQPTWTDPDTGMVRRLVLPRAGSSAVEVAHVLLPAHATVDYPVPPARPVRQHLVLDAGRLRFTYGDETVELRPGDALYAEIDGPTRFDTAGRPARYLLVQESA